MPETDRAKALVGGVVQRLTGLVGRSAPAAQQTLTIGLPAERVAAAWRDPRTLSQVLGDTGSVRAEGDGLVWSLTPPGGGEPVTWASTSTDEGTALRHTSADGGGAGDAHEVALVLAAAPQDLGTEATLRLDLPVPGLVAGGLALTLLYRLRALLVTGEVPTTTPQPAARAGER